MVNDRGRRVKVAEPSTPVSITGLNDVPMAGDHFAVYEMKKLRVLLVKNVQTCSYKTTSSYSPCQS